MQPKEHFLCPTCHIGHLDLSLKTYVHQYGETLISAPNTPAWVCDVCHNIEFDPEAIQRLEMLIGQGGTPPNRYRPQEQDRKVKRTKARTDTSVKARPKANR